MIFNDAGLQLLKSFEGCSLVAYEDQGGKLTIGYGHTSGVNKGDVCSAEEAEAMLRADIDIFCKQVDSTLLFQLTPNQYSAVICFTYNEGIGHLKQSTLLNCLNTGHPIDAANEFEKWDKCNGIPDAGLLRRRQAERALFETP